MKVQIETTSRRNGCLEQGGVCGRVVSYDAELILGIMEIDADDLDMVDGGDIVPHTDVTLAEYLAYHHAGAGHVVRRGTVIA